MSKKRPNVLFLKFTAKKKPASNRLKANIKRRRRRRKTCTFGGGFMLFVRKWI